MEVLDIPKGLIDSLSYNPETGKLFWNKTMNGRVLQGSEAGSINSSGYVTIGYEGVSYQASRVIWALVTGKQPEGLIDHINRDRVDNRFVNLRDVEEIVNRRNRGLNKGRLYKGLYRDGKIWTVRPNGRTSIGRFKCFFQALKCLKEYNIEQT